MTQPYSLHTGDCLEVLKTLDAESVDAIVTDPPYGLAFMGKKWDYDVPSTDIWQECLRVLKPGGHLLAFAGTRTQHRMACRIEDAGFEIRDMIAWVYGSGFPKSHNLKDEWQGWGTALKPALEPITMARKPLIGTVAENVLEHGTGGINVDGCRVEAGPDYEAAGFGPRYGHTSGNRAHGDSRPWIAQKIANGVAVKNSEPHTQGRWPANLIHDGSEDVVGLFPQSKSTGGMRPGFSTKDGWGRPSHADWQPSASQGGFGDSGSAARFYYCPKASKAEREAGLEEMEKKEQKTLGNFRGTEDHSPKINIRSRNHHPTVKPIDLMAYLCRLITPPGGTILDPFTGSGSTGVATLREGFKFIGIELNPEYAEIARKRIENELNKAPLFTNA
jgi:site-specific DNA-methyltransferase (adenine-specific)